MHFLTKRLNIIALNFLIIIIAFISTVSGQQLSKLTLEQANIFARENYPLIKKKDLVHQSDNLIINNFNKGFLPQLSINGQATYQSDVTKVDVPIPGFKIDAPGKDQYKVLADLSELVYDGGMIQGQKHLQQLSGEVETQQIEVELYKIKERINQLYLDILYLDEQLNQIELIKVDVETGIKTVSAQVENGVAFKSNLNVLKAELLKTNQRATEVKASRKGMLEVLELFLNQKFIDKPVFEKPVIKSFVAKNEFDRPEIKLFTDQKKLLEQQRKIIYATKQPRASLFLQSGYGRPALNLLKNQFDFFYIGGIRFNWQLSGLYTRKNELQLVDIIQKNVDIQKETFFLNTNTQLKQQQSEIDKLLQLISSDEEIITLRSQVKDASKAQLENGVITANDYLREVNAADESRQNLITHRLQLLQAQINYQTISGIQ